MPKYTDYRGVNLYGRTFGQLTVVAKLAGGRQVVDGISKTIRPQYRCRCSCGKELPVYGYNLVSGNSTSCGCKTPLRRNFVDLTEKTFGALRVLRRSEAVTPTRGVLWVCECRCGREVELTSNALTSGNNTTCGDKQQHPRSSERVGQIPTVHLNSIKQNATKRKLLFDVEPQYLWDLFRQQGGLCALSGIPIKFTEGTNAWATKRVTTASLDRIDNKKGYVPGNVRWIHKRLNLMRGDQTDEELIQWCQAVTSYQAEGPLRNNKERMI